MNRTALRTWTIAGAVVVALVLILASLAWQARRYRAASSRLVAQTTEVEARLRQMRSETAQVKAVPSAAAPSGMAAPVSKKAAPSEAERLRQRTARRQAMIRAWAGHAYSPFFRSTLLPSAQAAAFENAVVAHWVRWSDTADVFFEQHLAQNDPVVKSMAKAEWERFIQEEREALGPDAFKQLQAFERQAAVTPATDAVASQVFDTGEPLTADRAAALNQALATNSAGYVQGGRASLDNLDAAAVLTQLQGVLTPRQMEALRISLAARKYGPEIHRLLQGAATKGVSK